MKKIFTLIFSGLLLAISSSAQNEVSITVQVNPPYSPNLHDYENFLDQTVMMIQNNTGNDLNLRFIVTLTNLNDGTYFRSKTDLPVQPFLLLANEFRTLTGSDGLKTYGGSDINDYDTNIDKDIKSNIAQTGILPEGNYQLCVQAFQYDPPGAPLSLPQTGCAFFPITFVQPPWIIQPICGNTVQPMNPQQIIINWMPSTGNISGALINYDLYMVKVPEGISPFDAMDGAVRADAGIFIFHEKQIIGNQFIYGIGFQPLDTGITYAVQVIATDPTGKLSFANKGMSQVCSFTYRGAGQPPPMSPPPAEPVSVPETAISCESCVAALPSDKDVNFTNLQIGKDIKFGNQIVTVRELSAVTDNKVSGKGTLKFLNVPIHVAFSSVKVNSNNEVISGQGAAVQNTVLSTDKLPELNLFMETNPTKMISQLNPNNLNGYDLPLGLDKEVGGVKMVIAITGLNLTPTSAAFDAATVIDIPDANKKIALGGNICMKPNGICGSGVLYLANDVSLSPMLNMNLLAKVPADSGTYVKFNDGGFDMLRIKATYNFPTNKLNAKTGMPLSATIIGEGKNWSDWKASVTIEPFVVKGVENLTFSMDGAAFYDHSSTSNPIGIPATLVSDNMWMGFYLPKLKMELPGAIRSSTPGPVSASVTKLIIENEGVSGTINTGTVLDIGNGSLDSWYFSIDNIHATFTKNSFDNAGMDGKIVLPITTNEEQNRLDYHSTLTSKDGKVGFGFSIKPKTDVIVPLWHSQFTLFESSFVSVEPIGDHFKASANLSGKMDIIIKDIAKVNVDVKFKLMEFEQLVLTTDEPYVSIYKFKAGMASPQKDVSGFNVSLEEIGLTSHDGLVGPKFKVGINLSSLGALPEATFGLSVLGKPGLENFRPSWKFETVDLTSLAVKGQMGPAYVDGTVSFLRDDQWGSAVRGGLAVSVANLASVDCQALFGTKNDYNYFYMDANVKFPTPGIPLSVLPAPPISIFGMGMGLYYHLSVEKNNRGPEALLDPTFKEPTNKYRPNPSTAGFNGNIILGMQDGTTMMGKCSIEAEVNIEKFGINKIIFDGQIYTMCEPNKMENSIGKGAMEMTFDFANKIYDLQAVHTIEAKLGGISVKKVYGSLDLRIAPIDALNVKWYLKIGEPNRPCEMRPFDVFPPPYTALDFVITGKGYFMTGNDIPDGSPLNNKVREMFGDGPFPDQKRGGDLITGKAVVFGAGIFLPRVDENFLIFYLKFDAGIGFDIKFNTMTKECGGAVGRPGFNGYYANGQFYAYSEFDFGLNVDLWFYTGRVSAGKSFFKGALLAGLPNPTWFKGVVSAGFSVLGDQIKGTMHFQVKVGEECIAEKSPFGDGLPIISEILPAKDGAEVDQSISAGFNYPVEKEFTITDKNDKGESINRSFIIHIDYFNLVEVGIDKIVLSKDDNQLKTWGEDNRSLMIFPKTSYTPKVDHRLDIKVTAYETTGGGERKCKTSNKPGAADMTEQKSTWFKTGGCPESLNGKVLSSYPFPGQRYLLQEENQRKGSLILPVDYTCMSDPNYELKVKFTAYKNEVEIGEQVVDATFSDSKLNFILPTLPNQALIRAVVIKKLKRVVIDDGLSLYDSESPLAHFIDFSVYSKTTSEGVSNNIFMKKTSAGSKRASTEIKLYTYYFMTSEYNNLTQKLGGMKSTVKTLGINNTNGLEDMEMQIQMHEPFDIYDLQGQNYNLSIYAPSSESQFSNPPILDIREGDTNDGWRGNFVKPYFSNYFKVSNSPIFNLSMIDNSNYFGTNKDDCFLNPVTFSRKLPPLPPLTWDEIINLMPHVTIPSEAVMGTWSAFNK